MAAFSKPFSLWKWCFVPHANDLKHQGWKHPAFAMLLMAATCFLATTESAKFFQRINTKLNEMQLPPYAKKVGKFLLAYLLLMLATRMKEEGSKALYDMTWACNISILMSIFALLKGKPVLLAGVLVPISLDLFLWYLDCFSFLVTGKFKIGVAGYLLWPETTWLRRITTSHHLWFLPLIAKILKDSGGITKEAWGISCILFSVLTVLARGLIPKIITKTDGKDIYMNVNLAWEIWKDIGIKWLGSFDKSSAIVRLLVQNCFWNAISILGYFFIKQITNKK